LTTRGGKSAVDGNIRFGNDELAFKGHRLNQMNEKCFAGTKTAHDKPHRGSCRFDFLQVLQHRRDFGFSANLHVRQTDPGNNAGTQRT
jgi:hypothetical protein